MRQINKTSKAEPMNETFLARVESSIWKSIAEQSKGRSAEDLDLDKIQNEVRQAAVDMNLQPVNPDEMKEPDIRDLLRGEIDLIARRIIDSSRGEK